MGLMDMFFEKTEKQEDKTPPKRTQVQSVVVNPAIHMIATNPSTSALGPDYEEFQAKFRKILDDENKRNYPGNDYYEFVVMKNTMNVIPQEPLRYQAAYDLQLVMTTPQNKEEDYDKLITQFEWELSDTVELSQEEFNEYVHDDFDFAREARLSNTFYAKSITRKGR